METKILMSIFEYDIAIYAAVLDNIELAKKIAETIVDGDIEWTDFVPYITCDPDINPLEVPVNVARWYGSVADVDIAISEIKSISEQDVEYIEGRQS